MDFFYFLYIDNVYLRRMGINLKMILAAKFEMPRSTYHVGTKMG